ncbi:hypothetical protein, partial [Staphylococcus aureus]|uniref:hypothetical protein n=1 Tax=Staphylococcus aureus TaxID=1280 RepID=UPI0021B3F331
HNVNSPLEYTTQYNQQFIHTLKHIHNNQNLHLSKQIHNLKPPNNPINQSLTLLNQLTNPLNNPTSPTPQPTKL